MKETHHCRVEDIKSNGFIIYPRFYCRVCEKTKSGLFTEDLITMGVPLHIIRRCPVVIRKKVAYSQYLANLILTLMTTELGAGQIANIIQSLRSSYWASNAQVYLQALADVGPGTLDSFGFTRPVTAPIGFPSLHSHCGGYGGSSGPSKQPFQRLFVTLSRKTADIGDRVMMSLGGSVISADHTFNVPSRVKSKDIDGNTYTPVEGLHGSK